MGIPQSVGSAEWALPVSQPRTRSSGHQGCINGLLQSRAEIVALIFASLWWTGAALPPFNPTAGSAGQADDEPVYCYCQRISFGDMIACDNENCNIEWFHQVPWSDESLLHM